MVWRACSGVSCWWAGCWPAVADWCAGEVDQTGGDPLGSMQWFGCASGFLGEALDVVLKAVRISGPDFADDAMNVPLMLDARPLRRRRVAST
ncbi:MAG: hypothetical protein R3E42_09550 [Burkholderiaceae bacterium]